MALSRLQATSGVDTTFASSVNATFASPLTSGSIILLAWEGDVGAANSANTPTDTAGNTYVRVLSNSVLSTFDLEIWYALNTHTTASNKVTVTDTIGGSDGILVIEEWSGAATSSPTDGSASAGDATGLSSTPNSGSFSTANAADLIWTAAAITLGANDLSAGTGYSNLTQNHTTFSNLGIASKVVAATGSYAGAFTSSAVGSWACGAVAIKQLAGGTTVVLPFKSLMGVGI